MKRLSTFLLALMLMSIGANATSTDMTSNLNKNWMRDSGNTSDGTYDTSYYERFASSAIEGTEENPTKVLYESITGLSNGIYEVTFYAVASSTGSRDGFANANVGAGIAQVFANETVEGVTVYDQTTCTPTDYLHTLTCEVKDGTLQYGLQNVGTGGNWYVCLGVKLVYSGEALNEGDEVYACTADICHWTTTGNNGTHERNTWSTESDASGMKVPFCQNWVYEGDSKDVLLTTATISHNTLTGLTPGNYTVSMDIRIFSEAGNTIGSGTTFNANNASEDLDNLASAGGDGTEGTYNDATEVYGTYTLDCIVYDDGTLDISIVIPDGVTYNWIAWKNLSVTYSGPIEEPAIGYATADKTVVQPGEEVTITFKKVTPEGSSYTLSGSTFTDNTTGTDISVTYSDNGVFTFTVPETTEANSTFSITIPAGQLTYSSTEASNAAQTFTFTVRYMLPDELTEGVYLMNCHSEEFLSRGFAWGTEADADHYGIPLNIKIDANGLYTIQYVDNSLYIGDTYWAYADCSLESGRVMHYTIEPYDADGVTGYRFRGEEASTEVGADCYLYVNESGEFLIANNGHAGVVGVDPQNYDDIAQTVWQILSMEERDEHKAAFVASQNAAIAGLVSAADLDEYIDSKVANDVTRLVTNPDFSAVATSGSSGWVASNMNDNGNNSTNVTGGENGLEVYDGCEQIQQTITGLDQGVYKIDLKGFFRQATNDVCWPYKDYDMSIAYVMANDYEINLKPWGSEATNTSGYSPDSKTEAYEACASGYANELYTYVGSDGQLVITIAVPGYEYHEWMYVRGMALTYYGDEVEDDSEYKTGDEVTVDGVLYAVASDNMFVNGGFNNGMIGWTAGGYTTDAFPADFDVQSTGGFNNNAYLVASSAGVQSEKTPSQAVAITSGKKYLFIGYTTGSVPTSGNDLYSSLFKMTNATTEESSSNQPVPYVTLEWGASAGGTASDWTQTMAVFTAETAYAGVRLGWSTGSYDGFQLYEVEEVADEVVWTMTEAEWGTIILPFDASIPMLDDTSNAITWTAYSCSGLEEDGETLTLTSEATLAANTPYILSGTPGTYTFTGNPVAATTLTAGLLTGTFVDMDYDDFTHDGTQYLLQNHNGDVAFYPVVETSSAAATLTPYHCYLTDSSGKGVRGFISFPDSGEATAIVAVEGAEAEANGAIYDLSGRKVSKAVKGVYIQNGKKVLVK